VLSHPSAKNAEGWGTHLCGKVEILKNLGCATRHYSPNSWRGELAGKTGILMFQVNIWSDASGHAALWNGSELSDGGEHDYTSVSSGVLFWPIQ
jgi:hypothetical protein